MKCKMEERYNMYKVLLVLSYLVVCGWAQDSSAFCSSDQFTCASGDCIDKTKVCDGIVDCPDKTDETKDQCVVNDQCKNGLFHCEYSILPPVCIQNGSVCDGKPDCQYGEDELSSACTASSNCGQNTFRCSSNFCILNSQVCDHMNDCSNGLDEANCHYTDCTDPSQFVCSYGHCINSTLTCNGIWDCRDGSDETKDLCYPNVTCTDNQLYCSAKPVNQQCMDTDGFCSGLTTCNSIPYTKDDCGKDICGQELPCGPGSSCINLAVGFRCYCNSGFALTDQRSCRDINECEETPWVCDQLCTNTLGSYTCSCAAGYSATQVPGKCQRDDTAIKPVLYFAHREVISQINLDGSGFTDFAINFSFALVLDFDMMAQKIYHFDIKEQSLHCMDMSGQNDVLIDHLHSSSVEGIAIDWIYRKILWTNALLMGVYVAEMNGDYATPLVSGVSPNCRGIAVHPQSRTVLWTDWGYEPFIARIGLDGSGMTKVVTKGLFWPNGITIDYAVNRFWWVDALLDHIEYADMDGQNRHIVTSKYLSHPYSIVVFESDVYWSDWNYKSINVTNRYSGDLQPPLLDNLPIMPYDVKIYHPTRQPPYSTSSACRRNNGGCSHLCLPSPSSDTDFVCKCPQGRKLLPDGLTCHINCTVAEFTCNDGLCLPWYYQCNGRADCTAGEDEPSNCPKRNCDPTQYQCAKVGSYDKQCIPVTYLCDGVPQCALGDDEDSTKCSNRVCQDWEFFCNSTGRCIPQAWQCDHTQDCSQGEDEYPNNPKCDAPGQCEADQFKCANTNCTQQAYYCDVDDDCGDRSDEPDDCWIYRQNNPCPDGYKRCPQNYRCIPLNSFCDGVNDCRDGTDELPQNCLSCKQGEFTCANKRCIPLRWRCDFNNDCGDNSDENVTMCQGLYRMCTPSEFRCNNSRCLNKRIRCDGINDCGDGSDEANCGGCPDGQFQCLSGQCILGTRKCDGVKNCLDGSDEMGCPTRYPGGKYCPDTQFTCNNTICLDMVHVCDHIDQCGDGSDETPQACDSVKCPNNTFQCPTVRQCLPFSQVCDGVINCEFGGDESGCNNCTSNNMFQCLSDGSCIDPSLKCNYRYDCQDGSDEQGCPLIDCSTCQKNCTVLAQSNSTAFCSCWDGYIINPSDTRKCIERNDCKNLQSNWCPHTCLNQKSNQGETFKCICASGFIDLYGNGTTCLPADGFRGGLMYGLGARVRILNFTDNEVIQVNAMTENAGLGDVIAIDSDARKRVAYWMDPQAVYRAAIPTDGLEMAYVQKLFTVLHGTGLAFDWITGNIYWSDPNGIYVTSESIYWLPYAVVTSNSASFRPARILANPKAGMLYFVNDYENRPAILSVGMNGENMLTILNTNVLYPSDLAQDLNHGDRLFWTDGGLDFIESCLPDGSDRTIHLHDVKHPYRLDIFSGTLYWSTTDKDQIREADGMGTGLPQVLLSGQMNAGPVKYVNTLKYNMFTTNACYGMECQFCLLGPTQPTCVCPNGYPRNPFDPRICNITVPSGYVPLDPPGLCTCEHGDSCDLINGSPKCNCTAGYLGDRCEIPPSATVTGASPTMPGGSTSPNLSTASPSPGISISSSTAGFVPSSSSSGSTTKSTASTSKGFIISTNTGTIGPVSQSTLPPSVGGSSGSDRNRQIAIALPIVFGTIALILLILLLMWLCRRRKARGASQYGRHFDDSASVASYNVAAANPTGSVVYHGDAVQFGGDKNLQYSNPMYKDLDLAFSAPPILPDLQEKKHPDSYDQPGDVSKFNEGYDQFKSVEFAQYPASTDNKY